MNKLAFTLALALALTSLIVGARSTATSAATPIPNQLLPGETTTVGGAPAYDFGFNDAINYGSPNFDTTSSAQQYVKNAGLNSLARIWVFDGYSNAEMQSEVTAIQNAGMTCYVEMGGTNSTIGTGTSELSWLESTVNFLEPLGCHYFELGNEINYQGSGMAAYVPAWNDDVPVLKTLPVCQTNGAFDVTKCAFGGPAMGGDGSDGEMDAFLTGTAKNPADFVSWHTYPCQGASSWDSTVTLDQQGCLASVADGGASFGQTDCTLTVECPITSQSQVAQDQQYILGREKADYGHTVPTGISETNYSQGYAEDWSWAADDQFESMYQKVVTDAVVQNGIPFFLTFDIWNNADSGALDMLCNSANFAGGGGADPACATSNDATAGSPRSEMTALVAEVQKYGVDNTPPTLTCPPDFSGDTYGINYCVAEIGVLELSTSSFTQWFQNQWIPYVNYEDANGQHWPDADPSYPSSSTVTCPPDFSGDTLPAGAYCAGEEEILARQNPGMTEWLISSYDPFAAYYGYSH